ncbi:MAG: carboxypeptidase regulatory-like domain-containing protein [Gemmatimonadaceae bacterium]
MIRISRFGHHLIFAVGFLALTLTLPAQQTSSVAAIIRNVRGDSIPFAKVRATMNGQDISASANERGQFRVTLPFGRAHFTVTALGYEALESDVAVDRATLSPNFVLRDATQQLRELEVRAAWVGIRGGIGDEVTRKPVAGAVVTLSRGQKSFQTDSSGRFEIPMASAEDVVLQIERDGYVMRPARVDVRSDRPTDVVFFMTPGKTVNGAKNRLIDLNHRIAMNEPFSFTAGREEILAAKALTLYDAIISSGLLAKQHMTMGKSICLFVNGLPRVGFPVSTFPAADIDFIEVYGQKSDAARSLTAELPRGSSCYSNPQFLPEVGSGTGRRYVAIVSVWTRK